MKPTTEEMLRDLPEIALDMPTSSGIKRADLIAFLYYQKKCKEVFNRYHSSQWAQVLADAYGHRNNWPPKGTIAASEALKSRR